MPTGSTCRRMNHRGVGPAGTTPSLHASVVPHGGQRATRPSHYRAGVFPRGRQAVKVVAGAVDALRRPSSGLVILIYHRVGGRTYIDTDLPANLFEEQVSFLTEQTQVVTLDAGLRMIENPRSDPSDVVAITFDDGTADFAEFALPVLDRHRVPVTLYLATSFIEDQRSFPDDGAPISWDAVRDARSTGLVSVGSHTHRHALLDRLPPNEVNDELDRSIGLIEERLGVAAAHFAYPKAVPGSPAADAAVRARFRSAALAGTRANSFGTTDPYRLARSPVQVSDGMHWFTHKVRGGLSLEDSIRKRVNRMRYRNAAT
jgi:peptidoglycan/xylan/chitin deacetylase (PgdA/CDA1 family)